MISLNHTEIKGINGSKIMSSYGNFTMYHSSDAETIEEASMGYSNDGETPNSGVCSAYDFVGISFHLIQQTGGVLMFRKKKLEALNIQQTGGRILTSSTVLLNGEETLIKLLVMEE